jgi:hypothetical protein
MDCRTFQKSLEDYLEGGLDFPGRFGMERHAQQCYVCGKGMATAQRLSELAKQIGRAGAPVNLEASVLARIHARDSRSWLHDFWVYRFEWPSWRALGLAALSMAFVGITAFWAAREMNRATSVRQPELTHAPAQKTPETTIPEPGEQVLVAGPIDSPRETTTVEVSETPLKPRAVSSRRPGNRSSYSTEENWAAQPLQSVDADYLEYAVPGQGNLIMKLPKTIRMRYAEPSQEHFIRNVSH